MALSQTITQSDPAGKTSAVTGAANLAGISVAQLTQTITVPGQLQRAGRPETPAINPGWDCPDISDHKKEISRTFVLPGCGPARERIAQRRCVGCVTAYTHYPDFRQAAGKTVAI